MTQSLHRSGFLVSVMTFVSRILGLVRDVVIAQLVGAGMAADVFFFANRIPNFLRRLFAEGAFNQAFVPVIAEYRTHHTRSELQEFLSVVSGTLSLVVVVVVVLGMLGSGVVTAVFGLGWFLDWLQGGEQADKFELASLLLKITFPYLWFITLTAMSGALLNSFGHFTVPALTPALLNVSLILCALYLAPYLPQPEFALALGVLFGGVSQLAFQIPFLYQEGLFVWPRWGWRHPGVVKIRKLMLPALFGVSVSQINLLFDTLLASFLATGAISYLYYADRLLELPLGLFGIAVATVILPTLANRYQQGLSESFTQTIDWGVRVILLLGLPAMCGLLVLAQPTLRVLFLRGAFDETAVVAASSSLIAYTIGLVPLMLIKVFAPGYYARQDTKTPVRYGVIAMFSNMLLNLILIGPLGYVGLALATSLSGALNAYLLYRGLCIQGVYRVPVETRLFVLRLVVSAMLMTGILVVITPPTSAWFDWSFWPALMHLLIYVAVGAMVYALALLLCGVRLGQLRFWVRDES